MKKLGQTLCCSLVLMSSGCGTMLGHFGDCGSTPPPGVYRGTVVDAGFVYAPFTGEPDTASLLPLGLLDFPFSLVADTVIFPFDLADYIHRKKREDKTPLQPNTSLEPTAVTPVSPPSRAESPVGGGSVLGR